MRHEAAIRIQCLVRQCLARKTVRVYNSYLPRQFGNKGLKWMCWYAVSPSVR